MANFPNQPIGPESVLRHRSLLMIARATLAGQTLTHASDVDRIDPRDRGVVRQYAGVNAKLGDVFTRGWYSRASGRAYIFGHQRWDEGVEAAVHEPLHSVFDGHPRGDGPYEFTNFLRQLAEDGRFNPWISAGL